MFGAACQYTTHRTFKDESSAKLVEVILKYTVGTVAT